MVVFFLIPILILALVAAAPLWPYSKNWGLYPSGGLGAGAPAWFSEAAARNLGSGQTPIRTRVGSAVGAASL